MWPEQSECGGNWPRMKLKMWQWARGLGPEHHGLAGQRKDVSFEPERGGEQLGQMGARGHILENKERVSYVFQLGTETESTQATVDIYEKEEAIEVDYSSLREDLKVSDRFLLFMTNSR